MQRTLSVVRPGPGGFEVLLLQLAGIELQYYQQQRHGQEDLVHEASKTFVMYFLLLKLEDIIDLLRTL